MYVIVYSAGWSFNVSVGGVFPSWGAEFGALYQADMAHCGYVTSH